MLRRPNRPFGLLLIAVALSLVVRLGRGEEARWLDLTWEAPPPCPAGHDIEAEITRLVGKPARERGTLRAFVQVTGSDEEGWRARVRSEYAGRSGERVLSGTTCRAIAKAAALVIALTIDSNAGKLEESTQPTPREREQPPPSAAPDTVVRPGPAARAAPSVWFIGLGPRSELGLLKEPGIGLELGFGALIPAGSLEISGAAYLPESITVRQTGAGGRFVLLSAGLRLCPHLARSGIELFACAGASFDRLSAEGFGVTSPGSAVANLVTFALGPRVDIPLSAAFRLTLGIDGNYTPGRASFVIENVGRVHTATQLGMAERLLLTWYP